MLRLMHLWRFLFAAAVSAAAVLLAPSGAQAHAGHRHGPFQVERSVTLPHTSSSIRTGVQLKGEAHGVRSTLGASGARSTLSIAAASLPHGDPGAGCEGGCCHSAGQGCCAAALPALVTVPLPCAAPGRPLAQFSWGPGTTPGVLPEPPRHLV